MPVKIEMTKSDLLKEIKATFRTIEMPPNNEISFHSKDCLQCEGLRNVLETYREKEITGDLIRLIHQELSQLSAKVWLWIFPHYLTYCLTPEAEYNFMEMEFLVYALSPSKTYELETSQRLTLFNETQIMCIVHFLEWSRQNEAWIDLEEDIDNALRYLGSLTKTEGA